MASDDQAVRDAVRDGLPAAIAALGSLVRIPSIAFPGFPPQEVQRSAEAVADLVRATGLFERVGVHRAAAADGTPGNPAVLAVRAAAPGRPTVLLYAHHDVQPAGRDELWDSPPFEPTLVGDRLYGRGASDDKAGVVTHLAAVTAVASVLGDDFGVGVTLFIEGEEEAGSRSFDAFLAAHRQELDADVIVVADSDNVDTVTPALTSSLRGNVTFALTVSTLEHASHSGMFGGAVPDAMLATLRLLATLWGDDGSVAVPGLLRTVDPAAPGGPTEERLAADAGLLPGVRPIGSGSVADRLWRSPAITVTGIDAPDVKNASNTLQPTIRVRISVRVAPGQRAADAFAAVRAHLGSATPFGAHLDFADVDLGDPFLVDHGGWAAEAARQALEDGWGTAPVATGIGGSIPFVSMLAATFPDAQILLTGVEDPSSMAHSPNESQHLGVLRRAITAEALLLARLSRRGA
ncbi:MAG TPA: M20/M25/M40 family metallo-hydrolase [Amnibacterium sp.]|nr:M20/M25/M40 family metallo-hydrolase [Amnibacterium sp.]